jgi:large conductance mechanosensitive channel
MRHLWHEFRSFAFKGNMIDLAVAVVIGTAFGTVIKSLVEKIIMPLISYIIPNKGGYEAWHIGRVQIGAFLSEVLNFVLIAIAVFIVIIKLIGYLMKRAVPPPAPADPTTKECPMCLMTIPLKARKCGHCTADLPTIA